MLTLHFVKFFHLLSMEISIEEKKKKKRTKIHSLVYEIICNKMLYILSPFPSLQKKIIKNVKFSKTVTTYSCYHYEITYKFKKTVKFLY